MTKLTEHEAWCAILDVLEGYGMPDFNYEGRSSGLCSVVSFLLQDGVIETWTFCAMYDRIERELGQNRKYLARPYAVAPRIHYVRKFIEETRPK